MEDLAKVEGYKQGIDSDPPYYFMDCCRCEYYYRGACTPDRERICHEQETRRRILAAEQNREE
jgi:hypothetical protein